VNDKSSMDLGPRHRTVITAGRSWIPLDLGELWRYRGLFWVLAMRDFKVRYKQTLLGGAWAILQPFTYMVVFTMLFTLIGRYPTEAGEGTPPYPVLLYCGLLPWQLFASTLTRSGNSLVANRNLITKVYFPRLLLPAAPMLVALVDFALATIVLAGLMIWYGITPGVEILALPLFVLLAMATALAVSLWLSAINAIWRDVTHIIPFLAQAGMFVTPVVYQTSTIIPKDWQNIYSLNPMAGAVEGCRWALVNTNFTLGPILITSIISVILLLVGGLYFFRQMERRIADVV